MTDEAKGPRYGDIAAAPLVNHSAHRRHEDDRWTCWIERKDGQQIGEVYGDTGPEANANARKLVALPKLIDYARRVWDDCPLCGGSRITGTETQTGTEARHNPDDPDGEPIAVPVPIEVPVECELCGRARGVLKDAGIEVDDGQ